MGWVLNKLHMMLNQLSCEFTRLYAICKDKHEIKSKLVILNPKKQLETAFYQSDCTGFLCLCLFCLKTPECFCLFSLLTLTPLCIVQMCAEPERGKAGSISADSIFFCQAKPQLSFKEIIILWMWKFEGLTLKYPTWKATKYNWNNLDKK